MLNKYPFNNLDAYNEEAYIWATKEFDLIKDTKTMFGLDIDISSFAFASIYNHFLYISMNYPEMDIEAWLQDFFGKEDINKEWDTVCKYRGVVSGELLKFYKNEHIKIYNNLIASVSHEGEDDDGDKVIVDPLDNQLDRHNKHEQVMEFVLNDFNW